jgi:hypothetical protein
MNRTWILLVVLACPIVVLAQTSPGTPEPGGNAPPYQPAVPAAPSGGFYGGYPSFTTGGTAAGNAMNGMASVISAKGDYNLSTSAAAINMTQAQKNEIQNRQLYTNTYFEMRDTNRKATAAERGPKPTVEQIARIARDGVPKKLGPSQMNPVSGQLNWPSALQDDSFADRRGEVDQLFAARARYGGLNYTDQTKVREAIDSMFADLKKQVRDIPSQDYMACRNFLQSLTFSATRTELQ